MAHRQTFDEKLVSQRRSLAKKIADKLADCICSVW
jgi:hypothetical protein